MERDLTPKQKLREAYIEWIKPLDDWERYCHFTFRESVHPEQANKRFLRFIRDINRSIYGRRYNEHGFGIPGSGDWNGKNVTSYIFMGYLAGV